MSEKPRHPGDSPSASLRNGICLGHCGSCSDRFKLTVHRETRAVPSYQWCWRAPTAGWAPAPLVDRLCTAGSGGGERPVPVRLSKLPGEGERPAGSAISRDACCRPASRRGRSRTRRACRAASTSLEWTPDAAAPARPPDAPPAPPIDPMALRSSPRCASSGRLKSNPAPAPPTTLGRRPRRAAVS